MPFDSAKGYSGALVQQGRVQLDADYNDQSALGAHSLRVALADIFGGSCAPAASPGYGLRARAALEFDGSDRLILDDARGLVPGRGVEHTLELWLSWGGTRGVLADCCDRKGGGGYQVGIEPHGALTLRMGTERPDPSLETNELHAARPLPAHTPIHCALVIGDEFAAIYVDGRQVIHDRHHGLLDLEDPYVVLGGPGGDVSSGAGFVGLVSGIRAWRTARTIEQLESAAVSNSRVEDQADPVAVWSFDERRGSEITDAIGGRTARLVGDRPPRWRLMDLVIEPGRFYVEGVLCELPEECLYSRQPGVTRTTLPRQGQHVAYLEAWEDSVSAIEDPALVEVALGGLDTTIRTRVSGRVRIAPVDVPPDPGHGAAGGVPATLGLATTGRLAADHVGDYAPGNYLYRVEIHDSGHFGELADEDTVLRPPDATTGLRLSTDPYDLEGLHSLRVRPRRTPPTFKWSRDNGASLFALAGDDHATEVVDVMPAATGIEPLSPGDIVEPLGAQIGLDDHGHLLRRVLQVSEHDGRITLDSPLPAGVAYLRRWSHSDPEPGTARHPAGGQLLIRPGWIELEDGIRARFEDGYYRRGDYWWIVSRLDLGSIEWPREGGHPVALSPTGVERVTTPLALMSLDNGEVRIEDMRRIVSAVVASQPSPRPWSASEEGVYAGGDSEAETDLDVDEPALRPWDGPSTEPETEPSRFDAVEERAAEAEADRSQHAAPHLPRWHSVARLELPGHELQAAVSIGHAIIVATFKALFAVTTDSGAVDRLAELPRQRHGFALCALEDVLLLVGGGTKSGRADRRVLGLELSSGTWRECARVPTRRAHPTVVPARGYVHVIGGRRRRLVGHRAVGTHHVYDFLSDAWTEAAELPTHRSGATAVALGERVYVAGGHGGGRRRHVAVEYESFDLELHAWHTEERLPRAHPIVGSCAHHGRHVVLQAHPGHEHPHSAVAFDSASRTWVPVPHLPERHARSIVLGHHGHAHHIGARHDGAVELHRLA